MKKKLLLFDIDGTILRSGGASQIAFSKAFEQLFGVANAWGDLRAHGMTDPLIFRELASRNLGRALSSDEYAKLVDTYISHSERELAIAPNFRLMPNVTKLCEVLSAVPEFALGIQTGNFRKTADLKLKKAALSHHFSFGGYACDSERRAEFVRVAIRRGEEIHKTKFSSADTFVIGDTIHDIAAARAVGAKVIAVATGPAPIEELKAHSPDYVFPDLSNTQEILQIVRA